MVVPIFFLLAAVAGLAFLIAFLFIAGSLFRFIGEVIAHFWRFVAGMLSDAVRALGGTITALILVPITLGNVVMGRWSAAGHFGRAIQDEISGVSAAVYRVALAHPLRVIGLGELVEGIDKRIPEVVASAPGRDRPSKATGQFPGYTIVGSMAAGGSGAKLYIAEPHAETLSRLQQRGPIVDGERVVIKSFSAKDGASMPQIVRESRALEAARSLGLVLDHEMTDARFFYVMRYVPGDSLSEVSRRMHTIAGDRGLDAEQTRQAAAIAAQLCRTLSQYHDAGLWHKDVKPDNVIVNDTGAHLVDLGLLTPIQSAMTLTTHGTEYYRDPELVRMALQGRRVRDVEAAKFDIYGVGACLYSILEGSFPAHGGLSTVKKNSPEALKWIVRRAMTDLDRRYESMHAMLADLHTVMAAPNPFAVRPADLPSMGGQVTPAEQWWGNEGVAAVTASDERVVLNAVAPKKETRRSAREQRERAHARAAAARQRAMSSSVRNARHARHQRKQRENRVVPPALIFFAILASAIVLGTGLIELLLVVGGALFLICAAKRILKHAAKRPATQEWSNYHERRGRAGIAAAVMLLLAVIGGPFVVALVHDRKQTEPIALVKPISSPGLSQREQDEMAVKLIRDIESQIGRGPDGGTFKVLMVNPYGAALDFSELLPTPGQRSIMAEHGIEFIDPSTEQAIEPTARLLSQVTGDLHASSRLVQEWMVEDPTGIDIVYAINPGRGGVPNGLYIPREGLKPQQMN